MKYLVTLPLAPYLEQYVRHHCGSTPSGSINIAGYTPAATTLKRNLVSFQSENMARIKWPQSFDGIRVELPELERRGLRTGEGENLFWTVGPYGRQEIVSIFQAFFDMTLITDWTQTCAYYSRTMEMPEKNEFLLSFLERNGIEFSDTSRCSTYQRWLRLINRAYECALPSEREAREF